MKSDVKKSPNGAKEQEELIRRNQCPVSISDTDRPEKSWRQKLRCAVRIKNDYMRCFLAEFLGTFILIAFGDGTVAQVVLGHKEPLSRGNIVTINLGWGLAVSMGIYVAGGVSHGHINPAFSLVKGLMGELEWVKVPIYWFGQYLGAFTASAVIFGVYYDALLHWEEQVPNRPAYWNTTETAGIWATYPQKHIHHVTGFFDQVFGTSLLVLLALAITDKRNMQVPKGLIPMAVGSVVTVLTTAYEYNCGAALNPARDLGPRVFTAVAGWGTLPFTANDYWFWVPILGPHLGAILGMVVYLLFIGAHWPDEDEEKKIE